MGPVAVMPPWPRRLLLHTVRGPVRVPKRTLIHPMGRGPLALKHLPSTWPCLTTGPAPAQHESAIAAAYVTTLLAY
jgi:hypothetical protein